MTYDCRDYVDRWRIERSDRTKPAHLILDRHNRTADIRVIRIPPNAPPWVKADMTLGEWLARLKENDRRAAEARRDGYRPTSPASLAAEIDALPDGHWLKAKRIPPKWEADND